MTRTLRIAFFIILIVGPIILYQSLHKKRFQPLIGVTEIENGEQEKIEKIEINKPSKYKPKRCSYLFTSLSGGRSNCSYHTIQLVKIIKRMRDAELVINGKPHRTSASIIKR